MKTELSSQRVFFPDEAALLKEGRTDLVGYAGEQVSTGAEAQAYASYIAHHLEGIADGATYADLGGPEREAKAAVTAAQGQRRQCRRGRSAASKGHRDHRPARHAVQGRDTARPAAHVLRLGHRRPGRRDTPPWPAS